MARPDQKPDLDDFECTDENELELGNQMVVLVKWQAAMAKKGI